MSDDGTKRAARGEPEGAPAPKCAAVAAKPSSTPAGAVNDGTWSYRGMRGVVRVTPGDTPTRTSGRHRTLTKRARGVGAATEEEVAAAARARDDDTVFYNGKYVPKAERDAIVAAFKKRGPRPAAATPTPPKAPKIVQRLAHPSRDASASTDGALAASSSTDGGGGAGAVGEFGGHDLRRVRTVRDTGDAATEVEIDASIDIVCDGTWLNGKPPVIKDVSPYTDMVKKLYSVITPSAKRDIVATAAAEKKFPSPFWIKDDAHAKFVADRLLRLAVARFAQSHTLSLEADPNTKMTSDDADELLADLLNHGRAERGQLLITADDLQAKPLFRMRSNGVYDPIKANWADLGVNLRGWPVDATGALDPEKVAIFSSLPVEVAVSKGNRPVPDSAMRLVRKLVHTADPTADISITRFNKPGKPDTGDPILDCLDAFSLAFLGSGVDCGKGTCPFPAADKLDALGTTAHKLVLESFAVSMFQGAVKHKLKAKRKADGGDDDAELELDGGGDDAELDELVGRVTPERVAAVVAFAPKGDAPGWRVYPTAAAWAEMGITLADVVEFIKYVDVRAEKEGVMARV